MRSLTLALSAATLAFSGAAVAADSHAGRTKPMGDMTRAQAQARAEQMFDRMDANRDGTLNDADRAARQAAMFDRIDTDRNGSISRAEFDTHHAAMKDRMAGANGRKHARMGGHKGMRGDKAMNATRAQFLAAAMTRFDKADADRNGTVTQAERKAAWQAMRGEWQQRRAAAPQG